MTLENLFLHLSISHLDDFNIFMDPPNPYPTSCKYFMQCQPISCAGTMNMTDSANIRPKERLARPQPERMDRSHKHTFLRSTEIETSDYKTPNLRHFVQGMNIPLLLKVLETRECLSQLQTLWWVGWR